MAGCKHCSAPCSGRYCSPECRLSDQYGDDVQPCDDWPECPECDGPTSGEGVVCYQCRRDDDSDDGPGQLVADGGPLVVGRNDPQHSPEHDCPTCGASYYGETAARDCCGLATVAREVLTDGSTDTAVIGHCSGCEAPLVKHEDGTCELEGCNCDRGWDDD